MPPKAYICENRPPVAFYFSIVIFVLIHLRAVFHHIGNVKYINDEQIFYYLLHKGADSAVGFLHRLVKRLHFAAKESGEYKQQSSA